MCRRRGISRDTFYEYKRRYQAEGAPGLEPRSRRPVRSPAQIDPDLEVEICKLRKDHRRWGARRIRAELRRAGTDPPAVSTIHQALRRNHLVVDQPRKRPKATRRFEREIPNDLWQMDATKVRLADGTEVWVIDALDDHARYLPAARACPSPPRSVPTAASSRSADGAIRFPPHFPSGSWTPGPATRVRTIQEDADIHGLCGPSFNPGGTRITASCWDESNVLFVYDVASGRRVLTIRSGIRGAGGAAIYSPDGTRLATTCCGGSATIWEARTGRKLLTLQGHTGRVSGLAWSADGTRLATGGTDGTARIWDPRSGRQLMVLAGHAGGVFGVGFSPDGTRLLTGGGDSTARVWDVTPAGGSDGVGGIEPFPLYGVEYSPTDRPS